uniref:C2H2-type domain-containing protein n=2 Tax=Mus musculus TaxID=10090 RepID=Q3UMQ7_MOUSE|nr:unnamed protein product [Mus musculus]BAE26041.1 unnamed protein product [Mus musculus]
MEQPFTVDDEDEQDPEPQPRSGEPIQVLDDDAAEDAELIFVGVEKVKEDAELIFVGVTSASQPANSNILNRVTPGSRLKRKHDRLRATTTQRLQPSRPAAPTSEAVVVLPASPAESRSTDSPIAIEPLSESDYRSSSPQVVPSSSSKCCSPLVTLSSSENSPVKAALSGGDLNENLYVSKCHFSINPQRPDHSIEIVEPLSSALPPSGTFHTSNMQQRTPSFDAPNSLSRLVNGAPPSEDSAHPRQDSGLAEADFSSPASQETFDPKKGSLTLLLSDFYYGQYKGDGKPEQKTHTTFKCPSCLKALKNVKFMNHTKHHLELERQGSEDAWESHTTCLRCHRQFDSPFQLECHIDRVHTSPDPSVVCKICELSFETDQVLLQHMKDNHKPGEMPYVCQVCKYRSSGFADVETHFTKCHVNTKNLLCPFCLRIFKTGMPYMCHYRGHWERSGHQCSKCRLQFLTFKEKMEHKTQCHQMFKKPKQLEGLPPETKVVIQVSLQPVESESVKVASITVSTTDWEPSNPRPQGRLSQKPH